uniref:RNase H type-1 domain-containing protein n=1 Tax=Lactuca sativa TaxID=4236 RepID=A0A9R1VZ49_LACSA|nr:hypothetical protein LSAT_V11C300147310 [Lactuca sativa]
MKPAEITTGPKRPRGNPAKGKEVINERYPDQPINVGSDLPSHTIIALVDLLKSYKHVFTWTPTDMVGVERKVIEHKLMIKPGVKEVKQKKRVQGGDHNKAINAEVSKLTEARIVREVMFPTWIANPVMVRKQDGSWRMCIDFSDLNKACPKDCYPIPEIDQKVESLQGFKLKCFLEAYKGYHQILMSKEDEEKTTFYTDHGTFCYTKMPFGLKNAGATYHRLVDSIFAKQIGWNIEVYVDDMVIKSPNEEKMLQDIEETFKTLEVAKMKLNLAKCTFGVEEGQFLGYYVTRQGVQPSPSKVDEFIEMPTLNSLRDAQGLNGKLTTLSRFISKSVDKAMPLFHTLMGCIEKNNFQWTNEAEKALQRIKEALNKLSTLATPIPGETLQMYLSTSGEAISSILDVEREGEQRPVYFVSRALQGPELNYPMVEKLVLALIYAARRLRHYFQAHQIEVLTSYPIKQNLLKPETSGRLAMWAIELGEHDIKYRPRTSIKGQVLADFLLEIPDGGNPAKEKVWVVEEAPTGDGSWTLYTDGASSREGSGAGLILTSPEGESVTYALHFDFHTSNNEAEYEALLVGLRLAKQMGAKAVTTLTDSRLAANQVNGSFEVRDQRMGKYVKMVKQLIGSFGRFTIKQIPRSENKRADALSKLASTCFDRFSKKVLVEVLRERSIDEHQVSILTPVGPTWMTPFREYLQRGVLPDDHDEARKIRIKAPSFAMVNEELYKKGFMSPWLKCVDQAKGKEIL